MLKTKVIIAVIVAVMGMGFVGGKSLMGNNTEAGFTGDCEVYGDEFAGCCDEGEFEEPMDQEYSDYENAVAYSDYDTAECCGDTDDAYASEIVFESAKCEKNTNTSTKNAVSNKNIESNKSEEKVSPESTVMECATTEVYRNEDTRAKVFETILNEIPGTWEYRNDVKGTVCTMTFAEDGTVKLEASNEYYNDEETVSGTWKLVKEDNKAVLVYMLAERCFPCENEFELDNYYFDGNVDLSGLEFEGTANVSYGTGNFSKVY